MKTIVQHTKFQACCSKLAHRVDDQGHIRRRMIDSTNLLKCDRVQDTRACKPAPFLNLVTIFTASTAALSTTGAIGVSLCSFPLAMTNTGFPKALTSSRGLPSKAARSAALPGAIVPVSELRPQTEAAMDVALAKISRGVYPASLC